MRSQREIEDLTAQLEVLGASLAALCAAMPSAAAQRALEHMHLRLGSFAERTTGRCDEAALKVLGPIMGALHIAVQEG